MGITLRDLTLGKVAEEGGKTPFMVDAYSADVTGLEVVRAEPSTGDIYVKYMYIVCPTIGAGEWLKIQNDGTVIFQLLAPAGDGIAWEREFLNPIKFTANLKIDTENADPLEIHVEGFEA